MSNTHGPVNGATIRERQLSRPDGPRPTIEPPVELTGYARNYWDRHAPALIAAGALVATEVTAFVELAECYDLLQLQKKILRERGEGFKTYHDLLAKFMSMSRDFFLVPSARKKQSIVFPDNACRHDDMIETKGQFAYED